ncbi:MAG: hypothetical protein ACOYM3_25045 [Terrimicrobiaceae bacterium]
MKSIVHVTLIVVDYMLQLCVHEVRDHGDVRLLAPVMERYWVEVSPAVVDSLLREAEELAGVEIRSVDLLTQTKEEEVVLSGILEFLHLAVGHRRFKP